MGRCLFIPVVLILFVAFPSSVFAKNEHVSTCSKIISKTFCNNKPAKPTKSPKPTKKPTLTPTQSITPAPSPTLTPSPTPIVLSFATNLPTNQNGSAVLIQSGYKSITFNVSASGLAGWSPQASFDNGNSFLELHRFGCCKEVTIPIYSNYYRFSPGSGTIVDSVTGVLNEEPLSSVILFGQNVNYPFISSAFNSDGFSTITITVGAGDNPQNVTGISLERFENGLFVQKQHVNCDGGATCPQSTFSLIGGEYRVALEGNGKGAVIGGILRP